MKLRKFLPVCALLVLAGSTLAGCSNGNNAAPVDVSTEINIWATAAEEEVIKTVVDNYNKKQQNLNINLHLLLNQMLVLHLQKTLQLKIHQLYSYVLMTTLKTLFQKALLLK